MKPSWDGDKAGFWLFYYLLCMSGMMIVLARKARIIAFASLFCVLLALAFAWEIGWGHQGCSGGWSLSGELDCSKQYRAHHPHHYNNVHSFDQEWHSYYGPRNKLRDSFKEFFGYFGILGRPFFGMLSEIPFRIFSFSSALRRVFEDFFGVFLGPFSEMARHAPLKVLFVYLAEIALWAHLFALLKNMPWRRHYRGGKISAR